MQRRVGALVSDEQLGRHAADVGRIEVSVHVRVVALRNVEIGLADRLLRRVGVEAEHGVRRLVLERLQLALEAEQGLIALRTEPVALRGRFVALALGPRVRVERQADEGALIVRQVEEQDSEAGVALLGRCARARDDLHHLPAHLDLTERRLQLEAEFAIDRDRLGRTDEDTRLAEVFWPELHAAPVEFAVQIVPPAARFRALRHGQSLVDAAFDRVYAR